MTQSNETYNYDLKKHVDALKAHNTDVDMIIMHKDIIPENILYRYAQENSIEVIDNNDCGIEVRKFDLLKFDHDLVRRDPEKIAIALESVL